MKATVQEGWSYMTDDGRLKVSGTGRDCRTITVDAYEPGAGLGASETPSRRVTLVVDAEAWREIATAVNARLPSPMRGGQS